MCASDYYVRNYVCIRPLYSLFYMYFRSFATCVLILFVALAHNFKRKIIPIGFF